jgi:uncharacterized membrane protein HdeD (DUF308 family)
MPNAINIGTPVSGGVDQGLEPLRTHWGWIVALGIVFLIAGVAALSSVLMATVVSVAFVGAMMLVSGIAEIINAFSVKGWGKFLLWALLGVLYVVAGIVTFQNPLLAATVLTLVLGVTLVIAGCLRVFLATQMAEGTGWVWVVLSGIITLLLGGVVLAHWPVSSLYMLGIFLGVDLIVAGIGWISTGMALKRRT